eukprot:scaffold127445_cov20-Tisochrysis_lutea.AAC.2
MPPTPSAFQPRMKIIEQAGKLGNLCHEGYIRENQGSKQKQYIVGWVRLQIPSTYMQLLEYASLNSCQDASKLTSQTMY